MARVGCRTSRIIVWKIIIINSWFSWQFLSAVQFWRTLTTNEFKWRSREWVWRECQVYLIDNQQGVINSMWWSMSDDHQIMINICWSPYDDDQQVMINKWWSTYDDRKIMIIRLWSISDDHQIMINICWSTEWWWSTSDGQHMMINGWWSADEDQQVIINIWWSTDDDQQTRINRWWSMGRANLNAMFNFVEFEDSVNSV